MSEWNAAISACVRWLEGMPALDGTVPLLTKGFIVVNIEALKRPEEGGHKYVPSKSGRLDTCDVCGYPASWRDHA